MLKNSFLLFAQFRDCSYLEILQRKTYETRMIANDNRGYQHIKSLLKMLQLKKKT